MTEFEQAFSEPFYNCLELLLLRSWI